MKIKQFLLVVAIILTLLLSACSSTDWTADRSDFDQGWLDHQQELLDTALADIEDDETDIVAIFEAAFRYEQLGDYKNAVKYYEWTLELNPDYDVPYNNLAAIYEEIGLYKLASDNIKAYYDRNQTSIGAVKDTVRILLKNDELDDAELAFDNFVFLTDENPTSEMTALWSELKQDIFEYKEENGLVNNLN